MPKPRQTAFNSPLEAGMRSLAVLVAAYPAFLDLQRLVQLDYLTVHSADAGGPSSLHPPLPLRSGELLVRRALVHRGVQLMMSRHLIVAATLQTGFYFQADEQGGAFLDSLTSPYFSWLRERAAWATTTFATLSDEVLASRMRQLFRYREPEFYPTESLSAQPSLFPE